MDLFEAIEKRYSYRGEFKDEAVSRDNLIKIVKAGMAAPSGKNLETTEFVIIDDEQILTEVRNVLPDTVPLKSCKGIICCLIDKNPELVYEGSHFQLEDCAAAVENMLLAITGLGYASVWLDGVLRKEKRAERLAEIIGVPENKKIQIVLPVGVPVKEGPRKNKKSFEDRVFVNGYK